MFQCSDPACHQILATSSCECPRCGGKVQKMSLEQRLEHMRTLEDGWNGYDGVPPGEDTIRRAEAYLSHFCGMYRPARVAPSQAGGSHYGSICMTWRGSHDRRAYMEFYDGGGVDLMLSSPFNCQVLTYMSEHDGGAIQIIQSFLHGE